MQSFYREREERGGACSCRTLPDAKSPPKKRGGGGVLQSAFYTRIQLRQNAAGLANAKDRTGSFPSSKLQFYPPAY